MFLKIITEQFQAFCLLDRTRHLLIKCEEKECSKVGITREQYNVLCAIKFNKKVIGSEMIMSQIAEWLDHSQNSISTIVDRMEKDGLIKKVRNLQDRRTIRLRITNKANTLLAQISKPHLQLINGLFSIFSVKQLKIFNEMLQELAQQENKYLGEKEIKYTKEPGYYSKMLHFIQNLDSSKQL
jgi:MarR family transcriptional regulator, 2-MHQ and catechol-resistance regulon repressor